MSSRPFSNLEGFTCIVFAILHRSGVYYYQQNRLLILNKSCPKPFEDVQLVTITSVDFLRCAFLCRKIILQWDGRCFVSGHTRREFESRVGKEVICDQKAAVANTNVPQVLAIVPLSLDSLFPFIREIFLPGYINYPISMGN